MEALFLSILNGEVTEAYDSVERLYNTVRERDLGLPYDALTELVSVLRHAKEDLFQARVLTDGKEWF
jgi:hypothetical protein